MLKHLNVSSFIIIVRRGAGTRLSLGNSFCLQHTEPQQQSSAKLRHKVKRTLNTIGRLSSYLNYNDDKRKRNSRCIHHHYIIVHSYYQDKCACLCLCLYFGCHGKRSKVRTHVTGWHYARQYCPCLGLIKLPNRDRERGHNWSLMKWPPH